MIDQRGSSILEVREAFVDAHFGSVGAGHAGGIFSRSHRVEQALQAGHAGGHPEGPEGGEAEAGRVLEDHAGKQHHEEEDSQRVTLPRFTHIFILHHFLNQMKKVIWISGKQLHVGAGDKNG